MSRNLRCFFHCSISILPVMPFLATMNSSQEPSPNDIILQFGEVAKLTNITK